MPTPEAATDLVDPRPLPRVRDASGPGERTSERERRPAHTDDARPETRPRRRVARISRPRAAWAFPVATFFAATIFGSLQVDPAQAAETRFLALVAAGVLAAVVALGGSPRSRGSSTFTSGATVSGTLAVIFLALVWTLHHGPQRGTVATLALAAGLAWATTNALRVRGATPAVLVPVALGLQLLLRPDLLLPPLLDARTLVSVLVLPAVAGLAVATLASRFGARRALVAGALVATLAPGWNVTVTAWLLATSAVLVGIDRLTKKFAASGSRLAPAFALGSGGLAATVAAVAWGDDPQAATAGVLLLGLTLPDRGAAGTVVGRLAAGLLAVATLVGGYPWLHSEPLVALAGLFSGTVVPLLATIGLGLLALGLVDRYGPTTWRAPVATAATALLVAAVALALPRPAAVPFTGPPPVALADMTRQGLEIPLAGRDLDARSVVLEADLVHGDRPAPGSVVARVFLVDANGRALDRWPLRAGEHLSDWAAARPDLAGLRAPEPWLRQVAPSGEFFAQRYRVVLELPADIPAGSKLVIRRPPRLDPKVMVRLHRVELRP